MEQAHSGELGFAPVEASSPPSQAHYSQNEWPEAEVIAPLVQNGERRHQPRRNALTLESRPSLPHPVPRSELIVTRLKRQLISAQLYFRHVYAKLQPTIDDRYQSFENVCELFNYLLSMCLLRFI